MHALDRYLDLTTFIEIMAKLEPGIRVLYRPGERGEHYALAVLLPVGLRGLVDGFLIRTPAVAQRGIMRSLIT